MKKDFLIHKILTAAPLLIYMIIHMVWFGIIEKVDYSRCTEIHTSIDDIIPFCEYFIVPYFLWFLLVPAVAVYQLFFDETEFKRLSAVLISGMMIFLLVSTFFPNILNLRPENLENSNIFRHMVNYLYTIDTPTNVMPSLHVYNTMAVMMSFLRSEGNAAKNRIIRVLCIVLSVSIILATMFLKQHSVLDVTAAVILSILLKIAADRLFQKMKNN